MKFQDSSFNGFKSYSRYKKCDPRTHAPKAICPINFFKVGGIKMISDKQCVNKVRRGVKRATSTFL